VSKFFGFISPMNIGVGIVAINKRPTGYTGPTLWEDFNKLDALEWTNFLTAHGEPITDGTAHTQCVLAWFGVVFAGCGPCVCVGCMT